MEYSDLTEIQQSELEESVAMWFKEQQCELVVRACCEDDYLPMLEFESEVYSYVTDYVMERFGIDVFNED